MRQTLIGALAALGVVGFAGAAFAGCMDTHTVQQSTPVDTAQIEQPATPQTAKPADSGS